MEILGLPQWTLNAYLDGDVLEFSLGDGRRLVRRSRRPVHLLDQGGQFMQVADLLGADLAELLAQSAPRVLNIQFEARLNGFDWEMLGIGTARLAEKFALARQLVSANEPPPLIDTVLAETLSVTCIHGDVAPAHPRMHCLSTKLLFQSWARKEVLTAHVLVLDGVRLADLIDGGGLPGYPCLLVLDWPQPMQDLTAALDHGASVLGLEQDKDLNGTTLDALLLELGRGASVGEAVRWLYRRAAPVRLAARLYGDAEMRFVRMQAPASRRQVTSLSFDLVGSTTLLRRLGDEAYSELLVKLHARCTDVVRRHGGQPDDPQGDDGVMCYFGHPSAVEHAAVHAVETGLEIVRTVSALGVAVRIGIATGLVAIRANQPVGMSIHLAARLQQVTTPGTVLISDATRRLVAHAFDFKAMKTTLALKGIDGLEDYYFVLGPSRDANVHRLERLPWLTPLVGRQKELARLHRCWRQVHVGKSRLAVVRGDAGMGKSRLVREFRHQLVQAGVTVPECRCRADAGTSPYLTLAEALRGWLNIGADDATADALQKLAAVLPEESSAGEPLALIGALLGLVPQPAHSSAGSSRQRLLAALVDWFGAFVKDRPCCLIVEDWHWVDPSTREFVEYLMDAQSGLRLLVVLTTRGETVSASLALERCAPIELAGVTPEAARELVRLVCADAPLPAGLVRMLAERGDGVPLFLEEATRIALERSNEGSDAEVATLEAVPASLQDLLMARLDGLGPCKPVAQVAAVLGREFSLPILTALHESGVFALDAAMVSERLAALVRSGLVQSQGGGQFAFKHALIRDVAYASLWARDRQALHARVVTLFQERWPALVASRPELLAQHQTDAGQYRAALAQWELAASNATARSAEVEAVSHLRRALGVLARVEPFADRDRTALRLQLLLAARLIVTEGYGAQAVLQAYLEAQRLCDHIDDESARFKVEMGLEAYRLMRADFSLALEHGRRAAAIAVRSNDAKQVLQAHWGLACTLFHQGELRAAMREMEAGLTLYTPEMHQLFGVQDPGVMCMAYSSWGLWELGKPDSALARIHRAAEIAGASGHKFSQAVALAYGVSVELLRGETNAALTRADACIRVCEDSGFPVWLAIARCMRGRLLCEQGEFEDGLSEIRAGFALWLSTGAMLSRPLYLVLQTEGLMLAGEVDAAQVCVEEGLAISSRTGERQLEAELHRLRGELALRRYNASEAETWLKSAYATAIRQHRLGFALRSATSLARLWAADGREARAQRLLVPLVARWREGRSTRDVRTALALCESLVMTTTEKAIP